MKGSVSKTCSCPPRLDVRGRKISCKKQHGSWSFTLDLGRDPVTNKRRQLRRRGFNSQAEAQAELTRTLASLDAGQLRDDGGLTVATWLKQWMSRKEKSLRPTTLTDYRRHINVHIVPALGGVRLRDLRPSHVRSLLDSCEAGGSEREPLGTTSIRRVHATLRSALNDAVHEGLLPTNPAASVRPPRVVRPKVNPWSPEELGRFLDSMAAHPLAAYFELVAMTGLRRGEAAGLRWSDVDLDAGVITVRQQITHMDGECPTCDTVHKGVHFGPPKTASGEARRIDLGGHVVGVLLAHRLKQESLRTEWGKAYSDHDLVFPREDGTPMNPTRFTAEFQKLREASGARHVRLHDLRHGRASLLMASGTDIAVVSKMLGHSSIAITADTYSHLLEGVGRKAADAADALVPRRQQEDPCDQSVTSPPLPSPHEGETDQQSHR